jgi:hypothetical protein
MVHVTFTPSRFHVFMFHVQRGSIPARYLPLLLLEIDRMVVLLHATQPLLELISWLKVRRARLNEVVGAQVRDVERLPLRASELCALLKRRRQTLVDQLLTLARLLVADLAPFETQIKRRWKLLEAMRDALELDLVPTQPRRLRVDE